MCNCEKSKYYERVFYRSRNMTDTTVQNGSWSETTSYTNLYSDVKLTKLVGKYTETFSVSTEGGVYLFTGNFCLNGETQTFISFQDNDIYLPNKIKFTEPVVASGGKYLGKKGIVKTLLGTNVAKYKYIYKK